VLLARCGELRAVDDGVEVEDPDGDPFPAWPQDHPWACDAADAEQQSCRGGIHVHGARTAPRPSRCALGNEAYEVCSTGGLGGRCRRAGIMKRRGRLSLRGLHHA